ncbi:MAG: copper chaperone PCu(A)C [Boseongicola sp.]|nr:MAG: copper chaperone PCu(A)C [Boseongicola sp.]
MIKFAAVLVGAVALVSAMAVQASDMKVSDPVIHKAFDKARAAGGYMMIENAGNADDKLVGVRIEGRMAMIHESREKDGIMEMAHVDEIAVPAGGMVMFKPGGYHVMIMGLTPGELPEGEMVDAVLVFENAGDVPITFMVTKPEMGHGAHTGHATTN